MPILIPVCRQVAASLCWPLPCAGHRPQRELPCFLTALAGTQHCLAPQPSQQSLSLPQAPDEAALTALAETLKQHSIDHEVWTEQPENMATCLALRPYPKDQVHQYLKKFKLLK